MLTRMMLAGLLALAAVPALAGDVSFDAKRRSAVTSTDEARAVAGKRTEIREDAPKHACACANRAS